jgi:hypothetical protein
MANYYGERCGGAKSAMNNVIFFSYQMYMVDNMVEKRKKPKLSLLQNKKCKVPLGVVI